MIKLDERSLTLLKKCLKEHRPDLLSIIENEDNENYNEDFYNELRDVICDELIIKGFEGDTPTDYGLQLENLIDEIGGLFM